MIIGLDIDGCINDMDYYLKELLKKDYNIKNFSSSHNVLHSIGLESKKEQDLFWQDNSDYFNKYMPARKNANKIIDKLMEEHSIFILTAREYNCAGVTIEWLKINNINYHDIYFSCGKKADACIWKKVDYMIEDNPNNILELLKNGVKVIIMDHDYNSYIEHENAIRCKNWDDINDVINKLQKRS